jgi:hypothetical protein
MLLTATGSAPLISIRLEVGDYLWTNLVPDLELVDRNEYGLTFLTPSDCF